MKKYTPAQIEALTNWDGLLCQPPWSNDRAKRQYYSRHINRLLWRYFSPRDWRHVNDIIDDLRVSPKLKLTTRFLLNRHLPS